MGVSCSLIVATKGHMENRKTQQTVKNIIYGTERLADELSTWRVENITETDPEDGELKTTGIKFARKPSRSILEQPDNWP